jgi:hypothetical protein
MKHEEIIHLEHDIQITSNRSVNVRFAIDPDCDNNVYNGCASLFINNEQMEIRQFIGYASLLELRDEVLKAIGTIEPLIADFQKGQ